MVELTINISEDHEYGTLLVNRIMGEDFTHVLNSD